MLFTFSVGPANNTLRAASDQFVIEGDTQVITCQTDALNPDTGAGMRWFRTIASQQTIEIFDTTASISINTVVQRTNEYNGFTVTSTLSFIADRSHNQANHRCVPVWRGNDVTPTRDHTLTVYCKYISRMCWRHVHYFLIDGFFEILKLVSTVRGRAS